MHLTSSTVSTWQIHRLVTLKEARPAQGISASITDLPRPGSLPRTDCPPEDRCARPYLVRQTPPFPNSGDQLATSLCPATTTVTEKPTSPFGDRATATGSSLTVVPRSSPVKPPSPSTGDRMATYRCSNPQIKRTCVRHRTNDVPYQQGGIT